MIDAHCHLGISKDEKELSNLSKLELESEIKRLKKKIINYDFNKGLIYLLDEGLVNGQLDEINVPNNIILGALINPFFKKIDKQINRLKKSGIRFLKLLPYEQEIFKKDYSKLSKFIEVVNKNNMVVTTCCAYGSKYLYRTNGVELTSYLLNNGFETPLIMAHGGMKRILDAMSLMLEFPNLYMDISFSLSYWWGSTIIKDYAFALKKIEYERVFYGSDFPYVDIEDSLDCFDKFCDKYEIKNKNKNKILERNFNHFINNLK